MWRACKYIGTDPATLTMDGLCEMRDELPSMVEQLGYHAPEIELHKVGSEDYTPEPESLSMCCSSPLMVLMNSIATSRLRAISSSRRTRHGSTGTCG